jgi:hypothetical protein
MTDKLLNNKELYIVFRSWDQVRVNEYMEKNKTQSVTHQPVFDQSVDDFLKLKETSISKLSGKITYKSLIDQYKDEFTKYLQANSVLQKKN